MNLIEDSLSAIGIAVSPREIESLAVFVQRHMDGRSRHYHGLNHIFDLAVNGGPTYKLAAVYHDIIQLNTDTGYSPHVAARLEPYIELRDDKKFIKDFSAKEHFYAQLVLDIFSRKRGQEVTTLRGENEFLSALIAVAELGEFLKLEDMLQIIVCIEATIPFRLLDANGKNVFEILMERILFVNAHHKLKLSQETMIAMNQEAVELANNDVFNFADDAVDYFIFNTWALFPETSVPMRYPRTISTMQYRKAIQGTVAFFGFLRPNIIFHEFKGFPTAPQYDNLMKKSEHNLGISRLYFGSILHTCALLEAIGNITGGDAPLSLFIGDIPEIGEPCSKAAFIFPAIKKSELFNHEVYQLLHIGREKDTKYVLSAFPSAAFVYASLGTKFVTTHLSSCQQFFDQKISAQQFIDLHPQEFLFDFFKHLSKIVITRNVEMQALLKTKKTA